MERLLVAKELREELEIEFLDISDHRSSATLGKVDLTNVWLGLKHLGQFLARLVLGRPQVVYLGLSQSGPAHIRDLTFILPALLLRRKVVLHLRGSEFWNYYTKMSWGVRWLTRRAIGGAARIIVLGERLRSVFHPFVPPERVVTIPNGIDPESLIPRARQHAGEESVTRLLFLSSLRERKGIFVLLEALAQVCARDRRVRLTVAGGWRSDRERMEAEALIARFHFQHAVRFVGEARGADKTRLFQEHDLFVFTPVEPEGLPWVILEAMSAALPVITSDQGAIREVVRHGETGLIVAPTPEQVAKAICRLVENPGEARQMGQAGRRRVEREFSESRYFSQLAAVLSDAARVARLPQAGVLRVKARKTDGAVSSDASSPLV